MAECKKNHTKNVTTEKILISSQSITIFLINQKYQINLSEPDPIRRRSTRKTILLFQDLQKKKKKKEGKKEGLQPPHESRNHAPD